MCGVPHRPAHSRSAKRIPARAGLRVQESDATAAPFSVWRSLDDPQRLCRPHTLAYDVANARNIARVGVTAAAAREYPLAPPLDHILFIGARFGDESAAFVQLCDRFWMIGGGAQSEWEIRAATARARPGWCVR